MGGVGEVVLTIGYLSYLCQGHLAAGITHYRDPCKKKTRSADTLLGLEFMISGGKGQYLPTEILLAFLLVARSESRV